MLAPMSVVMPAAGRLPRSLQRLLLQRARLIRRWPDDPGAAPDPPPWTIPEHSIYSPPTSRAIQMWVSGSSWLHSDNNSATFQIPGFRAIAPTPAPGSGESSAGPRQVYANGRAGKLRLHLGSAWLPFLIGLALAGTGSRWDTSATQICSRVRGRAPCPLRAT